MEHVTMSVALVVLGYVALQIFGLSGLHKSVGKLVQKTETLEKDVADTKGTLENVRRESEIAHANIATAIRKSEKKKKKRIRKMEKKLDDWIASQAEK